MIASRLEVLLAIASSEFHQTTHVHYMPIGKKFTGVLWLLRAQKFIEPLSKRFYKVTEKGWDFIRTQDSSPFTAKFKEIDKFVDGLK